MGWIMTDKLKDVGKRIRTRRLAMNLSQAELAEKVLISPSHMSDIENGKKNFGMETFIRITEELQVSADWLLRTNINSTNVIVSNEIAELLADCTSDESQAMYHLLVDIKRLVLKR